MAPHAWAWVHTLAPEARAIQWTNVRIKYSQAQSSVKSARAFPERVAAPPNTDLSTEASLAGWLDASRRGARGQYAHAVELSQYAHAMDPSTSSQLAAFSSLCHPSSPQLDGL
eukprot:7382330-Prymnesium_polylepis.1